MMTYIITLALGLYFIYALRDMLLILQNRRDAKLDSQQLETESDTIIQQNHEHCKRFERAS